MPMVFCRGCGKEIHETAPICPQCGATQNSIKDNKTQSSPWLAIISLVLGILCTLSLFDDSQWDKDTIIGLCIFSITGIITGTISINKNESNKSISITGTILSSICTLIFIGIALN